MNTEPQMTGNIFLDKLRRRLAERGYVGEALEAELRKLMAKPLPPAIAELMQRQKRERDLAKTNSLEPTTEKLTDDELKQKAEEFKNRLRSGKTASGSHD